MNKVISLLIFVSALATGVLLFLSFSHKTMSKTPMLSFSTPLNTQKQTTLFFDPATIQILPVDFGKVHTMSIGMDTGNNSVSTIQLELQFNPVLIGQVVIQPASQSAFLGNNYHMVYSHVDQLTGRVSLFFNTSALQGKGSIAMLSFIPHTASGSSQITFLDKTMVTGNDNTASVLKNTLPLTLTVQ